MRKKSTPFKRSKEVPYKEKSLLYAPFAVTEKKLASSIEQKCALVEPDNGKISISGQCQLLGLARSSYYYQLATETDYNLQLMRLIDEQYTETPFYGVACITHWLRLNGYQVGSC